MIERTDSFFTILTDQDLHDHQFYLAHHHATDHIHFTIPIASHGHRTLDLAPSQCAAIGTRLLRFSRTRQLTDPCHPGDFQI